MKSMCSAQVQEAPSWQCGEERVGDGASVRLEQRLFEVTNN